MSRTAHVYCAWATVELEQSVYGTVCVIHVGLTHSHIGPPNPAPLWEAAEKIWWDPTGAPDNPPETIHKRQRAFQASPEVQ